MTSPQPPSGPIGRLLTPLLDRVTSLQRRVNESPTFHWATVARTFPLRVRIDGSTTILDATPDLSVPAPGWGDRVCVMFQNGRWVITGSAAATPQSGNLIPGANEIGALSPGSRTPTGFSEFGYNPAEPAVWIRGRANALTGTPFRIEAGVTYDFSVNAWGSVSGTRYYVQIFDAETGDSIIGVGSNSHLISNAVAGHGQSNSIRSAGRWLSPRSAWARLRFYANHDNGTSNPTGYQLFNEISMREAGGPTSGPRPFAEAAGSFTMGSSSNYKLGSTVTRSISFPSGRFSVAPLVMVSTASTFGSGIASAHVITTSGFRADFRRTESQSFSNGEYMWHAIQMSPNNASG